MMPRRKKLPKIPDYVGVPSDDNKLMVQKSNPLKTLSETGLSLVEFKILDAYLSRINSHEPEKRYVRFEKGELEKLLGVTRIPKDVLDARLEGLFKTVTIRDSHKDRGFTKIGLFERAEAKQDNDGLWQVDLVCTPSAMEYIFNIEVMGYLPYLLKNIIELTSRYSYVLYLYLESRRKSPLSNTWKVPIDELKQILRCNSDTYAVYKEFGRLLKKCQNEILKKTDLHFTYQPTDRKGRKYTAIQFTIDTVDGQLSLDDVVEPVLLTDSTADDYLEKMCEKYGSSELAFLAEACDYEFSREEMNVLMQALSSSRMDDRLERYNFLAEQYALLKHAASNRNIKHRFNYIKALVMKNKEQKG